MTLPWTPLMTISRKGEKLTLPEVTLSGMVCVWTPTEILLSLGAIEFPLWSRSLLKPWQLAKILPDLKVQYPQLADQHLAIMTASHQNDVEQTKILNEIITLTGVQVSDMKVLLTHPCAGKHLGYLAWLKAKNQPVDDYLNPANPVYDNHLPSQDVTHDGCGMPNAALSSLTLAMLYADLAKPGNAVGELMRGYPQLIGGTGRLDTRILSGEFPLLTIAKEGADGLLGVGIAPCKEFSDGAGILIKLASGYRPDDLEKILKGVLEKLGLFKPTTLIKHQQIDWYWPA